MYRVSNDEVEFILSDIKRRGVEIESLQLNLLDHICCILERGYNEKENFETNYTNTIKQFFKHELWEIEEETILLLRYKHYYKRNLNQRPLAHCGLKRLSCEAIPFFAGKTSPREKLQ